MNHHFLEIQAREKIEKYRSEGLNSQVVARSFSGKKRIIDTLRQYIARLLERKHQVEPGKNKFADNPEIQGTTWIQPSVLGEESR